MFGKSFVLYYVYAVQKIDLNFCNLNLYCVVWKVYAFRNFSKIIWHLKIKGFFELCSHSNISECSQSIAYIYTVVQTSL